MLKRHLLTTAAALTALSAPLLPLTAAAQELPKEDHHAAAQAAA